MQIAPKARTSVVDAIRLEPNPNRKAAQKKRVTISEESRVENANQVEIMEAGDTNGSVALAMAMRQTSIDTCRDQSMPVRVISKGNLNADALNLNSAASQRRRKRKFYTRAIVV